MGGHYTAYCRNPNTGEWYTFNDSRYVHRRQTFMYVIVSELGLNICHNWMIWCLGPVPPMTLNWRSWEELELENESWRDTSQQWAVFLMWKPFARLQSSCTLSNNNIITRPLFFCFPPRVTPMSSSQVRSSDAYVLFYELASSSRMWRYVKRC